jgi:hypothetical protein
VEKISEIKNLLKQYNKNYHQQVFGTIAIFYSNKAITLKIKLQIYKTKQYK